MRSKKKKGQMALEKVVKQLNIPLDEVRKEIQKAIDLAMANPDPAVQAYWKAMCKNEKPPFPEEVIERMSGKAKGKLS